MSGVEKYINLFESEIDAIFEEGEEEFEPDEKRAKIERFTVDELEELHEWLQSAGQMDVSEVKNFVMDHVVDWPRGSKSLRNAAVRMYMLMHGEQPAGMITNPESDWFSKEKMGKIFNFMDEKGYAVGEKLSDAQRKGKKRWDDKSKKKSKDDALQLMGDKFKEIKDGLGKDQIEKLKKARHDIIDAIMRGTSPDEAFDMTLSENIFTNEGELAEDDQIKLRTILESNSNFFNTILFYGDTEDIEGKEFTTLIDNLSRSSDDKEQKIPVLLEEIINSSDGVIDMQEYNPLSRQLSKKLNEFDEKYLDVLDPIFDPCPGKRPTWENVDIDRLYDALKRFDSLVEEVRGAGIPQDTEDYAR